MSFWLISVPHNKSGPSVLAELAGAAGQLASVAPFDLPALKVGTLDQLMALRSHDTYNSGGLRGHGRGRGGEVCGASRRTALCTPVVAVVVFCSSETTWRGVASPGAAVRGKLSHRRRRAEADRSALLCLRA